MSHVESGMSIEPRSTIQDECRLSADLDESARSLMYLSRAVAALRVRAADGRAVGVSMSRYIAYGRAARRALEGLLANLQLSGAAFGDWPRLELDRPAQCPIARLIEDPPAGYQDLNLFPDTLPAPRMERKDSDLSPFVQGLFALGERTKAARMRCSVSPVFAPILQALRDGPPVKDAADPGTSRKTRPGMASIEDEQAREGLPVLGRPEMPGDEQADPDPFE